MANHWKTTELVMEVGGDSNNDYMFKPLSMVLRGRWSPRNYPSASARTTGMMAMPDVPGMYIVLDASKRTVRVVDPLSLKEHARTLQKINDVARPWFGPQGPHEESVQTHLSDGQIKSILWELSEMARDGTAHLVHGGLPSPKQIIEMPGRIRVRTIYRNRESNETFEATEEEEAQLLDIATAAK